MVLSKSLLLRNRYSIQGVLGEVGPFDVTYLAWDIDEEREVVLREYFPLIYARRASDGVSIEVLDARLFEFGLSIFGREGELLNDFEHPSTVPVRELFRENGTLYRVSEHVTGASLGAFVKRHGPLNEEGTRHVMEPILEGLMAAHAQHLYHGGLSPRSIMITEDRQPVMLNFQMARTRMAYRSRTTGDILVPGFYPPDILGPEKLATWDIYSCGALLHFVLQGTPPVGGRLLGEKSVSGPMWQLMSEALSPDPAHRPASMAEYYDRFQESLAVPLLKPGTVPETPEIGFEPDGASPESEAAQEAGYEGYTFLEEVARTAPLSAEAVQVPAPRGSYLPEGGNNPHPEADLLKMVKRQQRFSMAVAAVVLLALIAIGITVYPRLTTPTPDALPAVASAAAPEVTPRDEPEIPLEVEEFVVEADAVLPVVSEADSPVAENSEPAATAATPVEAPTEAAPVEVAAAPAEETAPEVTPPAEPEQQDMVPQDIGPGVSDTGDEAFANLVAQADALLAQGQTDGALGVYESALALKQTTKR